MSASSCPFTRCLPAFVASQPVDGERDDAISNEVAVPLPVRRVRGRIVQTQRGPFEVVEVPVNVVGKFSGPVMPYLELRTQQTNARCVTALQLQPLDPQPPDEADLHRVWPPDRAKLARPSRHPVACVYPEIRVALFHALDLRRDRRSGTHSGGSVPKNL
jgi:hypothetical protein